MNVGTLTAIAALIVSLGTTVIADTITGKVTKVRDADTIVVRCVAIRLNGVDAPENGTRAGNEATSAMGRYVRGKKIT